MAFGDGPNTVSESTVSSTEESCWPSPGSGERAQSVPLSPLFVRDTLTEFLAELREFVAELSELSHPKRYV